MAYHFYSDPSHGWLRVPRADLNASGVAGLISRCSYQKGRNVYLEEDRDAGLFLQALVEQGKAQDLVHHLGTDNPSHIRRMDHYQLIEGE